MVSPAAAAVHAAATGLELASRILSGLAYGFTIGTFAGLQ
jgi:hypothetical protein